MIGANVGMDWAVAQRRHRHVFASPPCRIMHKFQSRSRRHPGNSGLFMNHLRRGSGYYIDVGASELVADGEHHAGARHGAGAEPRPPWCSRSIPRRDAGARLVVGMSPPQRVGCQRGARTGPRSGSPARSRHRAEPIGPAVC